MKSLSSAYIYTYMGVFTVALPPDAEVVGVENNNGQVRITYLYEMHSNWSATVERKFEGAMNGSSLTSPRTKLVGAFKDYMNYTVYLFEVLS